MILSQIIFVLIVGLVIAGLVAPNEALAWWHRSNNHFASRRNPNPAPMMHWPLLSEALAAPVRQKKELPDHVVNQIPTAQLATNESETSHYLVYLSGIGISGPDQLPANEIPAVNELARRLGDTTVIWDVYPYSVENQALTSGRRLSGLWRKLRTWKFEKKPGRMLSGLINIRNAFQMFVSSDRRYGPVFNLAVAEQIAAALLRHGYQPENKKPVTLLGWSGGSQIAMGATWYLASLGMPVRVISMAGILSADPGIDRAEKIWHLRGTRDATERCGMLLFAKRWPIFRNSSWNRGLASNKIELIKLARLHHVGKNGYYSTKTIDKNGKTPFQTTLDTIVNLLVSNGLASDADSQNQLRS